MTKDTDNRLRVVQVGLGAWGRDWARLVVPEVGEVELVGCVDSDPLALATLQELSSISPEQCFASLNDALEATKPQAVLVTTTLPTHAPLTQAALKAGMHVLVEKPFADTLECAQELVDLAAAKALTLMVSQNYRCFPASRTAARLVKEAPLGRLHQISIDFRQNDAAPPNRRRRHHFEAQPLLVDMSIHHFDLLRLVVGREPESIYCNAWNPDWSGYDGPCVAIASLDFGGDVMVSYRGSWISAGPSTPWAGEWRMDFEQGEIFWTSRGEDNVLNDRVILRPRGGSPRPMSLPGMSRIDRAGTLTEFASAVRGSREAETSGRDNLGTIAMVAAAVESATRREPVQVRRFRQQSAV